MTPHDLETLCRKKWGDDWKWKLSQTLGVSYRTINYWVKKEAVQKVVEFAVKWITR